MSSHAWRNVLTGISQGSFDRIFVKNVDGEMVDIITLLGSAGGITEVTGGGVVTIIANAGARQVVVNLSSYSTTAQINTLFDNYSTTAQMNIIFDDYSTTAYSTIIRDDIAGGSRSNCRVIREDLHRSRVQ
jgi:hypothetical protein